MWEKNTSSMSSRLSRKTTRSPHTGKEQNLKESTLLGIIMPGTPIVPAASPWMDTLQKLFSNMDTLAPRNRNSQRTNTVRRTPVLCGQINDSVTPKGISGLRPSATRLPLKIWGMFGGIKVQQSDQSGSRSFWKCTDINSHYY